MQVSHTDPHKAPTAGTDQTRQEQSDQSMRPDRNTSRPEHQSRPDPGRPDQTRAGKATQSEAKQSKENRSTAKQSKAKQIKSEASNVVQLTRLLGGKLLSTTMSDMLFGPEDPRLTAVRQEEWHKMADQPLYKKLGKELQQEAISVKELAWTYQQQRCEIDKDCFQHGLDSDRKHASIAHRRVVRESMDPTARLWSDAVVCLLWAGLACLGLVYSHALVCLVRSGLMLWSDCSGLVWSAWVWAACGVVWSDALVCLLWSGLSGPGLL